MVALGAAMVLLGPAAAQAEPDHPMDPLGANFGPDVSASSDGDGPRAPREPRTPGSEETEREPVREEPGSVQEDGGGSSPAESGGESEPDETTQGLEAEETGTDDSVADRIAGAWPGNDRKALQVARCESGLDPNAYNPAGPYYGLWQFDVRTWRGVGGDGLPSDASVEEQTRRAWTLRSQRGWAPWPVCG